MSALLVIIHPLSKTGITVWLGLNSISELKWLLKLTCMNESGPVLLILNFMNLHVSIALERSNL